MNALTLPDIAAQASQQSLPLEWVGMCGIALPLRLDQQILQGTADAGVNLSDGTSRGIHMSRLYLALAVFKDEPLSVPLIRRVLRQFLDSHEGLSTRAQLTLRFDVLLERAALVSSESGFKRYPIVIDAWLEDEMFHVELNAEVIYSSTCPCSAALARQLIQQQFLTDFGNRNLTHEQVLSWLGSAQGIVATPHSQRSTAKLRVRLKESCDELPILEVVDQAEAALGTAVQTAVKRADEQAFALANGQNLMFCEDAARRLNLALKQVPSVAGFQLRVEHAESLHAHDAVAQSHWNW
ncbi:MULTISPECIES: GTP cyclohydrolase FolE2 [unclassified Pseudomonas]|uniref:GTP cyclohydrolase FolE2 n=1 Tax=unclassified Pseudomonas TaxID=196821 RepID=UPI0021C90CB7|nr:MULTISPECIES: GTP cyclohydrolase FolE2 [unclassified Pseudomonas]MCU1735589.1 GTP cyclohydrolase FolE2 [Pseudomonas sp. 20P_3.2_Bac4]MCU1747156.1 GTP cyclohydrolase FolE2 [Pseudomonas sp. 20P_3.2_Bac5]